MASLRIIDLFPPACVSLIPSLLASLLDNHFQSKKSAFSSGQILLTKLFSVLGHRHIPNAIGN